jgi:hypothetical protein
MVAELHDEYADFCLRHPTIVQSQRHHHSPPLQQPHHFRLPSFFRHLYTAATSAPGPLALLKSVNFASSSLLFWFCLSLAFLVACPHVSQHTFASPQLRWRMECICPTAVRGFVCSDRSSFMSLVLSTLAQCLATSFVCIAGRSICIVGQRFMQAFFLIHPQCSGMFHADIYIGMTPP